jgi:hypothetical protein
MRFTLQTSRALWTLAEQATLNIDGANLTRASFELFIHSCALELRDQLSSCESRSSSFDFASEVQVLHQLFRSSNRSPGEALLAYHVGQSQERSNWRPDPRKIKRALFPSKQPSQRPKTSDGNYVNTSLPFTESSLQRLDRQRQQ